MQRKRCGGWRKGQGRKGKGVWGGSGCGSVQAKRMSTQCNALPADLPPVISNAKAGVGGKGKQPATAAAAYTVAAAASVAAGRKSGGDALSSTEEALAKMMAAVPMSEFERQLAAYHRKRYEHQRNKLRNEVRRGVAAGCRCPQS